MMRLTICGSAGSHPSAARACSGYLLETAEARVMLDIGNGSTANLQRLHELRDLDAIVISHRHIDHCIDLIGAFYALLDDAAEREPIPVYAAPDVLSFLTSLLTRDSTLSFAQVFDARTIAPGDRLEVGDMGFEFLHSVHPAPTVSSRITVGSQTFVYSSDSAGGDELVQAARGADAFLCEATWDSLDGRPPGIHLDGTEAGRIAKEAGVGKLLLTHVAGGSDRERIQRDAVAAFGDDGVVQVDDRSVYEF
jgi:ribonuclease BN (tRNA processing enzyme)